MWDGVPELQPDNVDRGLDRVLGNADFSERHRRVIPASADRVWVAALAVTPQEIRLLAPFMAVRFLPTVLTRRRFGAPLRDPTPILAVFQKQGFVELHRDPGLVDGRAVAVYGAAGRFWSPAGDEPVPLDGPQAFVAYGEPGTAKTAFSIEVVDRGGHTEVITETRIVATDAASRRAFGLYRLLIRGPSGLIRRSWLAAIHRRATA
jgi:hypothetical protein